MRCVSLYKIGDHFVLNPMAKTTTDGLIGTMTFIKIPSEADSNIIGDAILTALNQYKENVTNPTDWKKFANERGIKLKAVGINSETELNKRGNKFCLIKEDNMNIEIIPSKNDFQKKYFGHLPSLAEHVEFNNNYEQLLASLRKALAKCQ